ncbi:MAG: hypothetical protein ABSA93_39530 [Streptosporangiaceae bacterium]
MTSSPRPPHVGGRPDPIGGTTALGGESAPARGYLLDNARAEAGERFVWLAELFDGVTRGHFERLGVRAGSRCWEVGAGGPSIPEALAAAVGPTGHVLATDIDPWVTGRATRFLTEAGYSNVQVVTGDGEHAADRYGPFDKILVTAGAWDCPWARLLTEGGRMVVPLIVSTYTRSVTFVRHGDRWDGEHPVLCGFISMKGAGAGYEQHATLPGQVHLALEGGPALSDEVLGQAIAGARTEVWTGVTFDDDKGFFSLNLHLAAAEDRAGMIWNEPGSSRLPTAARWFTPALVEPASVAFLTSRPASDASGPRRSELGVHAYGGSGPELARDLVARVREWDTGHRHQSEPQYTLYPAGTPVEAPSDGRLFSRQHVQITLSWP